MKELIFSIFLTAAVVLYRQHVLLMGAIEEDQNLLSQEQDMLENAYLKTE